MSEQPLRILLVDDEELVRSAVRVWLEDEQFQIVEAASGAAALELLKNEPFDCCLLDLQLSDMSGVDVLKAARSGPRQPAWLVMTGNLDEETYQELKALAIEDAAILAKPIFDMDVLTGKILTAAGR